MTRKAPYMQGRTFRDQASRRVSFVLPTRNRAEFIGKALDMARWLVGPDDELIVVDGASTDGTAEIIAGYEDLVNVFISEPDTGPTHAMNKAMLMARGKYIKWLTDDDEFFPNAMEQAIEVLEANPEVDVLVCGGMVQRGSEVHPFYKSHGVNYGKSPEDAFKYGVDGCGVVIRRSVLAQVGMLDPTNVASDSEFIARTIYNGATVKFCRIKLFHQHILEHSTVISRAREHRRGKLRALRQYCSCAFYVNYYVKPTVISWIKRAVVRGRVLHWPALTVRHVLRTIMAILGSKGSRAERSSEGPVWDGGFS